MASKNDSDYASLMKQIALLPIDQLEQDIAKARTEAEELERARSDAEQRAEEAAAHLELLQRLLSVREVSDAAVSEVVVLANGRRNGRKLHQKRQTILDVMREIAPEDEWPPVDVFNTLRERGSDVTLESVQNTMHRMAKDHQLRRVDRGFYELPAAERRK